MDYTLKRKLKIVTLLQCLFSFEVIIIGVISFRDYGEKGENSILQVSAERNSLCLHEKTLAPDCVRCSFPHDYTCWSIS